jgi:hypothetical protein
LQLLQQIGTPLLPAELQKSKSLGKETSGIMSHVSLNQQISN